MDLRSPIEPGIFAVAVDLGMKYPNAEVILSACLTASTSICIGVPCRLHYICIGVPCRLHYAYQNTFNPMRQHQNMCQRPRYGSQWMRTTSRGQLGLEFHGNGYTACPTTSSTSKNQLNNIRTSIAKQTQYFDCHRHCSKPHHHLHAPHLPNT